MSDDTAAEALASAMNATLEPRYEGFALTVGNTSIILAALDRAGWALVRKRATVETAATAGASSAMWPGPRYPAPVTPKEPGQ